MGFAHMEVQVGPTEHCSTSTSYQVLIQKEYKKLSKVYFQYYLGKVTLLKVVL